MRRVVDNYPYFYRIFIFYACMVYIGAYKGRAQARLAGYEILLYILILIILLIYFFNIFITFPVIF